MYAISMQTNSVNSKSPHKRHEVLNIILYMTELESGVEPWKVKITIKASGYGYGFTGT